jgi:hypothetical protein
MLIRKATHDDIQGVAVVAPISTNIDPFIQADISKQNPALSETAWMIQQQFRPSLSSALTIKVGTGFPPSLASASGF